MSLVYTEIFASMEYVLASTCRIQFLPIVFYTNLIIATAVLHKNKDIVESQVSRVVDENKVNVEQALEEGGYLRDDSK
jgi:purine nucleoside phosphorylase